MLALRKVELRIAQSWSVWWAHGWLSSIEGGWEREPSQGSGAGREIASKWAGERVYGLPKSRTASHTKGICSMKALSRGCIVDEVVGWLANCSGRTPRRMSKYGFRNGLWRIASTHTVQYRVPAFWIVVSESSEEGVSLALLSPQPLDLGSQVVFGSPLLVFVRAFLSPRSAPAAG